MTILTPAPKRGRATLDDLHQVEGKAELINGEIVHIMGSGFLHGLIAGNIYSELRAHALQSGSGVALGDNIVYGVKKLKSNRESFSPDASFYVGKRPENLEDFISGPPTFAVEIRGKDDHGVYAERKMAEKRADYFEAGTGVVWDVDPTSKTVTRYCKNAPSAGDVFRIGQIADAEPALPGWRIPVADVFR